MAGRETGEGERRAGAPRGARAVTRPPTPTPPPRPPQTLLNFHSKRRLLITGTPLQNDLMELWSLLHFLMPHVFASHASFRDWFSQPLTAAVEGAAAVNAALVARLHAVLRPFLLRRLKADVEKSLPPKHEHVLRVPLSRRQRALYEDYLASSAASGALTGGGFLGVVNVLMQLRKVCNHPDLFAPRPVTSALDAPGVVARVPGVVVGAAAGAAPALPAALRVADAEAGTAAGAAAAASLAPSRGRVLEVALAGASAALDARFSSRAVVEATLDAPPSPAALAAADRAAAAAHARGAAAAAAVAASVAAAAAGRSAARPLYGADAVRAMTLTWLPEHAVPLREGAATLAGVPTFFGEAVVPAAARAAALAGTLRRFVCVIPKARAPAPVLVTSGPARAAEAADAAAAAALAARARAAAAPLHPAAIRQTLHFPDRRLIQYDCGKLQAMAGLLRTLKAGGHRVLIFTQMSRMLDILEQFLNLHGHTYCRLDGSTKPEARQVLMQRFNASPRVFAFILSTRSGGVGMNLTGADTVIFYDADWNPAMDAQAQDRCHRIGQVWGKGGAGEREEGLEPAPHDPPPLSFSP